VSFVKVVNILFYFFLKEHNLGIFSKVGTELILFQRCEHNLHTSTKVGTIQVIKFILK